MRSVLAVVATRRLDTPEATEFLRVLVALRACEVAVELVEAGEGLHATAGDPTLTPDGERLFEALRAEGVVPGSAPPSTDLAARLEAASDVIVLPDPGRTRIPALVRWADVRGRPDAVERALESGSFVRS